LIGATAGRTTLHGEGLQHQDGHSHLLASTVPNARSYDPAFGFELAAIILHGLKRIQAQYDEFFYITTMNEAYTHPAKPEGIDEGIIQGMYLLQPAQGEALCDLLGSGAILNEVIAAAVLLRERYAIEAAVWSVTSFNELRRHALACDHHNIYQLDQKINYIEECLGISHLPVIAATDYLKIHADQIRCWVKRPYAVLGTDGFGRSDLRKNLRDHFEVSTRYVAYLAIKKLIEGGLYKGSLAQIQDELGINRDKIDPLTS
jgi:pyruvate dehydrogenase E1 component